MPNHVYMDWKLKHLKDWECGVLCGDFGTARNGAGDVWAWCEETHMRLRCHNQLVRVYHEP